jgi:hypothetical protein
MPVVPSAQTVHLSYTEIETISKRIENKLPLDPRHLGVQSGASKMISMPMLRRGWHYLQTVQNELPLDPRHVGVPSGVPKIISMPMVRSAQTVHLSCIGVKTISKQTEMIFHLIWST